MWRVEGAGAAMLHVVIGASRIEWGIVRPGVLTPESTAGATLADSLPATLATACDELCAAGALAVAQGTQVQSVRVLIADSWLLMNQVPWSDELQRDDGAARYAKQQLEAAGFEIQDEDTMRIDEGPYGEPRIVLAYPAALLASLQRVAQAWAAELKTVLPLSVAAWRWARAQRGRDDAGVPVLVWAPGCLMVLQGQGPLSDVMVRGAAFGFDGTADAQQALMAQWQRMSFRSPALEQVKRLKGLLLWPGATAWPALPVSVEDVPLPAKTAVPALLLSAAQPSLVSALDAVSAKGRAGTVLQKVLVACLVAASVAIGLKALDHTRAAAQAGQQLAEQSRRDAAPADKPAEAWREEPARVTAVNAAVRELNLPVSALMLALQAPRDLRVSLLSVDMTAAGSSSQGPAVMKIVAEARSGPEMARYVSHISGRTPIGLAYLTRHEVLESNPEQPYRFMVEAQWMP